MLLHRPPRQYRRPLREEKPLVRKGQELLNKLLYPLISRSLSQSTYVYHKSGIMKLITLHTPRGPERDHLSGSGRDIHEVFDTPIGKVGLLVCWDLAFPEAFRELIANGAKIM